MERLSVTLPVELVERVRDAAEADGATLSGWLARAAEAQLVLRGAAQAIAAWEREYDEACAERTPPRM